MGCTVEKETKKTRERERVRDGVKRAYDVGRKGEKRGRV